MKIIVHRDKCIGAGQCVATAPALFDQDPEEGLVVLTGPDTPSTEQQDDARMAAQLCPALAIEIKE